MRIEPMRWWHIDSVADIETRLFPDDTWSREQFWSELAQPTRRYWVAIDNDKVCGYAGLFVLAPDADIQTIAVDDLCRGKGIGRSLLTTMLDEARSMGCTQVLLEVRAGNAVARGLYASMGFDVLSTRPRYYPDGEDAVVLRCEVKSRE